MRFRYLNLILIVLLFSSIAFGTAPQVASTNPTSGPTGTQFQIIGSGFGSSQGTSTVTLGGRAQSVVNWSDSLITAVVSSDAATGAVSVTVAGVGSNATIYFNIPGPQITSISPTTGGVGTQVTVTGSGFQAVKGSASSVNFNGWAGTVVSWSDTQIVASVSSNAKTGPVMVMVNGVSSNQDALFTMPVPTVTGLTPTAGLVGTSVQIVGTGFGAAQGSSTVQFNSVNATATFWSDTQITAAVPTTATSGTVRVSVGGINSVNNINFTIPPPQVSSVSPSVGIGGTQITVNGSGFQATKGTSSTLTINQTQATTTSWSDTQIVANVPSNPTTGAVRVTVNGVASNGDVLFNVPNPIITSVTPSSGAEGSQIVISGTGFGSAQGSSTITLAGYNAPVISWSDTQITANVPLPAGSGVIRITVSGITSQSSVNFSVNRPQITSLSPSSGGPGTQVTVNGSNFGATQTQGLTNGSRSSIYFNGLSATVVSWSDTQIVATVPSTATTGPVTMTGFAGGSNVDVVFSMPNPIISSLSPSSASVGTQVQINGSGFGATQGNGSSVTFSNQNASIVSWSDSQIVATVPSAAISGSVVVISGGVSSNTNINLTVPHPQITSISPTSGIVGTQITVNGSGFQNTKGSSTVLLMNNVFNNTLNVVSWSDSQIVVTVPSNAATGDVSVTVNGIQSNRDLLFTLPKPVMSAIFPNGGPIGTQVQILGSGFGATQGTSTLVINGTNMPIVNWADTLITATIPTGVTSGSATLNVGGISTSQWFTVATTYVSSFSPLAGPAGTSVTLTGSGFGASQGSNTILYNNVAITPTSWSDTQIVANVPAGAASAYISVKIGSNTVSAQTQFVVKAVAVNSISPTNGPIGSQVQINGTGFGATQGTGSVVIGSLTASVVSWSDTAITATVPNGDSSGSVTVTAGGVTSNNNVLFTVNPCTITGISPASGPAGTQVTVHGSNFGATQGSSTLTFYSGTTASIVSWSDTAITATVPSGVFSGSVYTTVGGVSSNTNVNFTIPLPNITGISPASGVVGTQVTVTGSGFLATKGTSTITFNGVGASVVTWSDTQIVANVPSSATGPVRVMVRGSVYSNNDVVFSMPNPVITSLSPATGPMDTLVQINGSGFGATQGSSTLTFANSVTATPISWSDTLITAKVPSAAVSGVVAVNVGGVTSASTIDFNVPLQKITSISPNRGIAGTQITVSGAGFHATKGAGVLYYSNFQQASIVSWSDTQIVATVTSAGSTGGMSVYQNSNFSNSDVMFTFGSPFITGVSPASGPVGTQVQINGSGFGTTQGSSSVAFRGIAASIISWSDNQIIATVPTGAGSGTLTVSVASVTSNTNINFTVPTPKITSLSPTSGIIGTTVTINGSGFQSAEGIGSVAFADGHGAPILSWSDTQIVVQVPSTAISGAARVQVNNSDQSNQDFAFTLPNPLVTGLVPSHGPAGTQVQVNGTGFGATQGSSTIAFGSASATVVSWSDTQIVALVPNGVGNSNPVKVTEGGILSNTNVNFTVPTPTITSLSPSIGGGGNSVSITGTGFQSTQGQNSYVTFANFGAANIKSWTDTQVVAVVPPSATTTSIDVSANGGISNYVTYTVPLNAISSVSPNTGPVGTQVTISGVAFGATQGTSSLTFNGQPAASIVSWSNTQIVATVPVTATSGPVIVRVNNANSDANHQFAVPPPQVLGFSPQGGIVGTTVTINGSGFQASQRDSTITFNGIPATATTWTDTQIIAAVPSGAATGQIHVTVNSIPNGNGNPAFEVPNPVITSVTPPQAPAGGSITIAGSGFGASQWIPSGGGIIYVGSITLNGADVGVVSWSDTSITVALPSTATSGSLIVTKYNATSSGTPFTVAGAPAIAALTPSTGPVNGSVVLSGSNFGSAQYQSTVQFNGNLATVTSWSDSQITALVPPGTETGPAWVTIAGVNAPSQTFTINTSAQITDSLGRSSSYTSVMLGGSWLGSDSQGSGCSSCTVRGTIHNDYDLVGNLLATTDELLHKTDFTYDANGNVASQTAHLDANTPVATSYTYNSFGEPLTVTDPLGNVTTNTYDANGNLLTVTSPKPDAPTSASVTQFAYDAKGQLTQITDPLNHITTLAYYPTGLIHTITDAQSNVTSYEYDLRGNRTAVVDAQQNRTTFAYDLGNRLTGITYPDTTSVSFAYDGRGRRTSVTDQNGKVTSYAYDDADRLTSVTDAAQNVTTYAYDLENNLTSITDAAQHTTSFVYDAFGRVTQTAFPSALNENYVYDALDNLTSKVDRKNQTISFAYDALNRLTRKGFPDATGVDYVYDLVGKIKQVSDPTGTYGRAYDNMGRLVGTTTQYTFLPGHTYADSYTYDAASNQTGFTAPDGSTNVYSYDTLNRLTGITDSAAGAFTFAYDALSRITGLNRPNGVNTTYGYDSLSRLLNVLHKAGTITLDGAGYTYDNAGNRTSNTNHLNNITQNYTYDALYQLTQVTQGATTTESYTYDSPGNRLSSLGMSGYAYNSSNQLTSTPAEAFTYDANGNTLTKTDASGVTSYTWDFMNQLTSVTLPGTGGTVTFKYDPFGRRIQKSVAAGITNYLYSRDNALADVDSSGAFIARYLQSGDVDQPLASVTATGMLFFETDGLNSVTSLSGAAGGLTDTYTYTVFGTTAATGTNSNRFRYTGREWDQETGLYYYRARYYDPEPGRFITEDPSGVDGGINLFAYTNNNPLRWTDPFGLMPRIPRCPSGRINPARPELNRLIGPLSAADSANLNRGCIGMTSAYQGMGVDLPEAARGTQCFATEAQARARSCKATEKKFIFAKQGQYEHGAPIPGPNGQVPRDTISSAGGNFNYIVAFPGGCYGWMNNGIYPGADPQQASIAPFYPSDPHYPHTIWCSTCCSKCMKSQ